jgi:hypothetical protein
VEDKNISSPRQQILTRFVPFSTFACGRQEPALFTAANCEPPSTPWYVIRQPRTTMDESWAYFFWANAWFLPSVPIIPTIPTIPTITTNVIKKTEFHDSWPIGDDAPLIEFHVDQSG